MGGWGGWGGRGAAVAAVSAGFAPKCCSLSHLRGRLGHPAAAARRAYEARRQPRVGRAESDHVDGACHAAAGRLREPVGAEVAGGQVAAKGAALVLPYLPALELPVLLGRLRPRSLLVALRRRAHAWLHLGARRRPGRRRRVGATAAAAGAAAAGATAAGGAAAAAARLGFARRRARPGVGVQCRTAAERRGELIDPFPQLAWLDAGEEGARRLDAPVGRPFERREHHLHGASVRQSGWAGRETSRREECKDEFGMGGA